MEAIECVHDEHGTLIGSVYTEHDPRDGTPNGHFMWEHSETVEMGFNTVEQAKASLLDFDRAYLIAQRRLSVVARN